MKTKNIFKALALAMLMPAMLLTTACSNDDDVVNTSNITSKGYALPVTVNVTRQDDGATRASFDGSKLNFSAGDKLFVSGDHYDAGSFAGTLNYDAVSGKFSGTIYTQNSYEGNADDLFTEANPVKGTLLPNGYGSTGFLSINNNSTTDDATDDYVSTNYAKAIALTKNAAVEQLSWEQGGYNGSFVLQPRSAILNFTITGFAASTQVAVVFTSNNGTVNENVTTDTSGNATFALGVSGGEGLHNCSLSVGGNSITLVSSSKTLEAGHIYNITRAVTPPTLAQTMNTAGMTVKVKYNYDNDENYCLFSSVGDGTYTFQSGDGWAGGDVDCAKALVVEGGKLVFKQNFYDSIDDLWSDYGFSVTFDTSKNTYSHWVGPATQEFHNPSFISVEVNSVPIALTQIITVSDLVKGEGQSWFTIIANNSDKIEADGDYVVRISDGAKLQRDMSGYGDWQDVRTDDDYQTMWTYKFEGD